jgi:hypothetical protein
VAMKNNVNDLVLLHMFGYLEQKLLDQSQKCLVFLKSNFFVRRNFKFQYDPFNNFMSSILICGPFLHQFPNLGYRKRILLNTSSMPLDGAPTMPT